MKKTYIVNQNDILATAKVQIDFSKINKYGDQEYTITEGIKDMVEFWSDWEFRLALNDGDYTKTFLKDLLKELCLIYFGSNCNYNLYGLKEEFNNKEGYCKIDGSYGITLLQFDPPEILNDGDYSITEL